MSEISGNSENGSNRIRRNGVSNRSRSISRSVGRLISESARSKSGWRPRSNVPPIQLQPFSSCDNLEIDSEDFNSEQDESVIPKAEYSITTADGWLVTAKFQHLGIDEDCNVNGGGSRSSAEQGDAGKGDALETNATTECPVPGSVEFPKDMMQCSNCSDDARATSWCFECAEFICDNCVQAHKQLKVTKGHTIKQKEAKASSTPPDLEYFETPYSIHKESGIYSVYNKRRNVTEYVKYSIYPERLKNRVSARIDFMQDHDELPARRIVRLEDPLKIMGKFHLVPFFHVEESLISVVGNARLIIMFNRHINRTLWRQTEKLDLDLAKHYVHTEIHVGELRMSTFSNAVLKNYVAIYNRIFKVRACLDKVGKYHLWCYAFENRDPPPPKYGAMLSAFYINFIDVWLESGIDIMKHQLKNIISVNEQPFNLEAFQINLNTIRRGIYTRTFDRY